MPEYTQKSEVDVCVHFSNQYTRKVLCGHLFVLSSI